MNLLEFMLPAQYDQVFHVYMENAYEEYLIIGHGYRCHLMDERENGESIDHLLDKVESWYIAENNSMVVCIRSDRLYHRRVETMYDPDFVKRWDSKDPKTRPWRYLYELPPKSKQNLNTKGRSENHDD